MSQEPENLDGNSCEDQPFRIVAIYDSAESSAEAARASAIVLRELGDEVPVDRSSWNVVSLDSSSICHRAAAEAARADMIVVALSDSALSSGLKAWVAEWEKNRKLDGGLLALIPSGGEMRDLEECLYEAAVTAQMDFLCRKERRY